MLGHEKLDVFPEFAPVSVEIQTDLPGPVAAGGRVAHHRPARGRAAGRARCRTTSGLTPSRSCRRSTCTSGPARCLLHARQLVQERLQTTAPTLPTWCDPPQMYPIVSATSRVMQIGLHLPDASQHSTCRRSRTGRSGPGCWACPVSRTRRSGVSDPRQIMVEGSPAVMAERTRVTLDELMSGAADAVDTAGVRSTPPARRSGRSASTETAGAAPVRCADIQPIQDREPDGQVSRWRQAAAARPCGSGRWPTVAWGYPVPATWGRGDRRAGPA